MNPTFIVTEIETGQIVVWERVTTLIEATQLHKDFIREFGCGYEYEFRWGQ